MLQITNERVLALLFPIVGACLSVPAAAVGFSLVSIWATSPDNNPAGRDVAFNVTGMSGPLADVSVSMTLTHTYVRDLRVELISPSGVTRRIVYAGTGANSTGGSSNLAGTYVFGDRYQRDWWLAVAAADPNDIPPGAFRASTAGVVGSAIKTGGCASSLTFAFDGLLPAQINGSWTLRISDLASTDLGTITAAKLNLVSAHDQVFGSGFDSVIRGSCVRAQFDYTGSNRSSYVLVRITGGESGNETTWYVRDNDGTPSGFERTFVLGNATDFFIGGDFDGDGRWDPAIWSPGAQGHAKILLSSRPNGQPMEFDFGTTGDDPTQSGDYDGDGKTDFAVYRSGAMAGDASVTLVRLSTTGATRILPTGENGNFAAGGSDITGDGIADVAVQSNAGGGNANFDIHSGTNGSITANFLLGTPTDVIVCGNHSGDALADTTVVRGVGGVINWTTHDSGTNANLPAVGFGASATDFPLSGDFDGDGLDDYAIWQGSPTPGLSHFSVRPSSNPSSPFDVNFGQNADYPVANSRTHSAMRSRAPIARDRDDWAGVPLSRSKRRCDRHPAHRRAHRASRADRSGFRRLRRVTATRLAGRMTTSSLSSSNPAATSACFTDLEIFGSTEHGRAPAFADDIVCAGLKRGFENLLFPLGTRASRKPVRRRGKTGTPPNRWCRGCHRASTGHGAHRRRCVRNCRSSHR